MYGQFQSQQNLQNQQSYQNQQNQQNFQNQLLNYGGQNQYVNQQQSNGSNYQTPTEMRMYHQSHLSPMIQQQGMQQQGMQQQGMQQQGMQNVNQNYSQGAQASSVYNSNRTFGQGETYVTPIEQRMYQHSGVQQPNISSLGANQNYNQYNQSLAQNFGQSSAQFGGQYNPWVQQQQQQQQQQHAGQVYNSNNLYGQGETYITPSERQMYQTIGIQPSTNQFSHSDIHQGQTYATPTEQRMLQNAGISMNQMQPMQSMQSMQPMPQNYSQNPSQSNQAENKGQYYVTPSEQRMLQNSGVNQFSNQFGSQLGNQFGTQFR